MRLEAAADENCTDTYEIMEARSLSFLPVIRQICNDVMKGVSSSVISSKFHNTLVAASLRMVKRISGETGLDKVVLSGGTFQNRYLSERLERKLRQDHFEVYVHKRIPCNDGGVALGQLMVAAKRNE